MNKKILIIGYGSAGRRFAKLVNKNFQKFEIFILTKQNNVNFNVIREIKEISKINPDFIIICSPTKFHFEHLNFINKYFKRKNILVEKPLFHTLKNLKKVKNKIFVGYNMRSLKIIKYLKSIIEKKRKTIRYIEFINHSYLPYWRKNIDYKRSSSAKRNLAGGVILDCSHEIDLATWLIGKIKLLLVEKSKKSNLKIQTEDNCVVLAKQKNITIKIDFNYASLKKIRKITLKGKDFKFIIDLVTFRIIHFKNKKKTIRKFRKNQIQESYFFELKNFLNSNKRELVSYKSALKTQKTINQIQNF